MSDNPIISKETLLKGSLPEEVVTIEGLGTVRVRSLSRTEFMRVRQASTDGWEIGLVAHGLVEPALTEAEVEEWRNTVTPHVFDDLAGEVLRVSGLRKAAEEEAKRSFPPEQGA